MTTDVHGEAADELDVPDCARHLLDIGRQQLAAIRERERAEKERKAAEERARFEAAFAPVRAAVAAVVPEGLLRYVDWQEKEFKDLDGSSHPVELTVPGCLPVHITMTSRNPDRRWEVYCGFFPGVWDEERQKATNTTESVESLPVALALAREGFLAQREHDDTAPL